MAGEGLAGADAGLASDPCAGGAAAASDCVAGALDVGSGRDPPNSSQPSKISTAKPMPPPAITLGSLKSSLNPAAAPAEGAAVFLGTPGKMGSSALKGSNFGLASAVPDSPGLPPGCFSSAIRRILCQYRCGIKCRGLEGSPGVTSPGAGFGRKSRSRHGACGVFTRRKCCRRMCSNQASARHCAPCREFPCGQNDLARSPDDRC